MSAHDFEFKDIDDQPLSLARFTGHPLLVVNTASECGFTPQYAALQNLWSRYRDAGLIVLGVPVITSYSIHYTKLYEAPMRTSSPTPVASIEMNGS